MAKIIFLLVSLAFGFKECSSGSDTAKPQIEYLVTPFFPHRTPRAVKCKFSLSVNYGEYIKLVMDVMEVPCAGQNGIYIEEEGGRSGPFCGNKRMPSFISRDVKFDIHILIDTPLRGARVKIGYKTVTSPKGPNVTKLRGGSASKMPVALLKMAPDQGQGQLQQQNQQNELTNGQQEISNQPPSNGWGKQAPSRRGHDSHKQGSHWVSETYNPIQNEYPDFTVLGKTGKKEASGGGAGVQLVLPVLVLMILIGVLILVIHKRRQRMKEDLKKLENATPGGQKNETRKRDFIPIEQTRSLEKTEPTIDQINIEASNNAASIETTNQRTVVPSNKVSDKPVPPAPANTLVTKEKTISTDSAISTKSKDSQATTAPSIKSECPTRPLRAPVVRPTRKKAQNPDDDEDRPSY